MKFNNLKHLLLFSIFVAVQILRVSAFTYCESFIDSACNEADKNDCIKREKCGSIGAESEKHHCFTLWEFNANTGESNLKMKGCFINNKDCYKKSHCIQKSKKDDNQLYFCCCNGNMCNKNHTFATFMEQKPKTPITDDQLDIFADLEIGIFLAILSTCIFFFIISLILITRHYEKRKSESNHCELAKDEEIGDSRYQQENDGNLDVVNSKKDLEERIEEQFGDTTDQSMVLEPLYERQYRQTEDLRLLPTVSMDETYDRLMRLVGAKQILGTGSDNKLFVKFGNNEKLCYCLQCDPNTVRNEIPISIISNFNPMDHSPSLHFCSQGLYSIIAHQNATMSVFDTHQDFILNPNKLKIVEICR